MIKCEHNISIDNWCTDCAINDLERTAQELSIETNMPIGEAIVALLPALLTVIAPDLVKKVVN